jgi:hypothetical protein
MIGLAQPWLLGLAALAALPLLIHWLSRRRAVARSFPALALLAGADAGRARRRRLRDALILACRVLALLACALAAADLVWNGALAGRGRPLVVVLDASASMQQTVAGASAFDRARSAAADLLRGAGGRPVAAVVAGAVPRRSGNAVVPNAGDALALFAETAPGASDGAPAAAVAAAVALLPAGGDLAFVSDLARSSLGGVDPAALPPGVRLRLVDAGPGPGAMPDNCGITAILADPARPVAERPLTITVRVANSGPAERSVALTLRLGSDVRSLPCTVAAGGVATVSSIYTPTGSGSLVISASLPGGDVFAADDQRAAVLAVREALVAVVAGDGGRDDPRGALRPLAAGLAAAGFRVRVSDAAGLAAALDGAVLCATAGVRESAAAAAAIGPWMTAGGTWLQIAAAPGDAAIVPTGVVPPVALGKRLDLGEQGGAGLGLGQAKLDHPLFAACAGREALLAPLRAYRVFLTPTPQAADAAVLAAWSDGTIACAERPVGAGRWLQLNVGSDAASSSLASIELWPLLCAALPTVLAGGGGSDPAVACGSVVPGGCTDASGRGVERPDAPGLWRDATGAAFAAVVPGRESDLRPFDPRLMSLESTRAGDAAALAGGAPLWPWLIVAALLILGIEMLLAGGVRR